MGHEFLVLVQAKTTAPVLQRHQLTRKNGQLLTNPWISFSGKSPGGEPKMSALLFVCFFLFVCLVVFGQSDMGEILCYFCFNFHFPESPF